MVRHVMPGPALRQRGGAALQVLYSFGLQPPSGCVHVSGASTDCDAAQCQCLGSKFCPCPIICYEAKAMQGALRSSISGPTQVGRWPNQLCSNASDASDASDASSAAARWVRGYCIITRLLQVIIGSAGGTRVVPARQQQSSTHKAFASLHEEWGAAFTVSKSHMPRQRQGGVCAKGVQESAVGLG